jgi:drug/metabolite transporter (DMT)-like permease
MNNKQKGILFSILTSISIGLNVVIGKLLVDVVNAETMNVLWFAFASILFIFLFVLSGKRKNFSTILKNWKKIIIISFLVTIGALLWTYGILYAGPTNVAFLIQFTTVFTILLGIIFLKEKFTKLEGFGILIAVIGILFLTYGNIEIKIFSTLIILGAAFCFSLSNFFSKIYVKNIDAVSLAGGRSIFIFLLTLSYSLFAGKLQLNIPTLAFGYAFLGALTGAFLGFILFYKALEVFEISKSMAIRTIEPFLTAIFSFFILSMIPTQNQIGGGVLIVLGIIILSLTKR